MGQGHHVAQHHAQHRQHGEQQLPLGIKALEAAHQDAQGQGKAGGLGAHRKERHHRRRRALVDIGGPLVEGHCGDLEGHRGQHENQGQGGNGRGAGAQGQGYGVEAGGTAGEAVKQGSAVEKYGRGC